MREKNLRGVVVRVVVAAVVLAAGVAVTEIAVRRENEQAVRMQRGAASILADSTADRLSSTLQSIASASQSLEAFVLAHDGDVDRAEVPAFLDVLLGDSGGESRVEFRSISLAPNNRIAVIAPVAGNEAALGLSFPDHPDQWAQIEPIIQSGQTALVGPFPLVQGGSGLALRLPVRLSNGDYWGLVSTVVDSDALLAGVLGNGADPGLAVALRLEPGAQSQGADFGDVSAFSPDADLHSLEALGRTWQVSAMSVAPLPSNSLTRMVGYGLSLVVALLVYLLIAALQRRREVSRRLTSLSARVPGVLYQLRVGPDGR
ncbi:MAG: hypothetical protein GC156_11475 [Actinomycetales bacterium]|nr:hypothetical protein [Actinomycetales bacterium]